MSSRKEGSARGSARKAPESSRKASSPAATGAPPRSTTGSAVSSDGDEQAFRALVSPNSETPPSKPSSSSAAAGKDGARHRLQALMSLSELPADEAAKRVSEVVLPALDDPSSDVRLAAMCVLTNLPAAGLAEHAGAAAKRFDDPDADVRMAAMRVMQQLDPPQLAKHAAAVVERIADKDSDVRLAVVLALGKLKPWKLEQLAPRVVDFLHSEHAGVRYTALEVKRTELGSTRTELGPHFLHCKHAGTRAPGCMRARRTSAANELVARAPPVARAKEDDCAAPCPTHEHTPSRSSSVRR